MMFTRTLLALSLGSTLATASSTMITDPERFNISMTSFQLPGSYGDPIRDDRILNYSSENSASFCSTLASFNMHFRMKCNVTTPDSKAHASACDTMEFVYEYGLMPYGNRRKFYIKLCGVDGKNISPAWLLLLELAKVAYKTEGRIMVIQYVCDPYDGDGSSTYRVSYITEEKCNQYKERILAQQTVCPDRPVPGFTHYMGSGLYGPGRSKGTEYPVEVLSKYCRNHTYRVNGQQYGRGLLWIP